MGAAELQEGPRLCRRLPAPTLWHPPPHLSERPLPTLQIQSGAARLSFSGSLLQLRGLAAQATPLRDPSSGALLVWNGEVFSGIPVQLAANDSAAVLEALTRPGACVPEVLSSIRGPWALVFWQPSARTLWFGRDVVGEWLWLHWCGLAVPVLVLLAAWLDKTTSARAWVQGGAACCSISHQRQTHD